MKGLTQKQLEVLKSIELYTKENGISPTLRELQALLGLSSPATVHTHLKILKQKGYLTFDPKSPRSLSLFTQKEEEEKTIPLFGTLCQKNGIEPFRSPPKLFLFSSFIKNIDLTYALRVKGNWLKEELIQEHDLLIIEATNNLTPNALILGKCHSSHVIKRVFPEGRSVKLSSPTHTNEEITIPLNELEVLGVVISLIRNYEE